ncbi:MAG: E3 ubiquitin protein ligase, partial [Thermoplasmata archaeon]
IVEVVPEDSKVAEEETYEVEEILPATFFELDSMPSTEFIKEGRPADEFENEEAIQQYLNISNNFSVELESDEIYNVIVYLSCLDAGIYNIYPITINFKDYPRKPVLVFTDDLLVRIRGLDRILDDLRTWDPSIPMSMVNVLQKFEDRLIEDSMVESEFEVIRREYKTRRLSKNRIMVTLSTYGQRFYDVELDLKYYPFPPLVTLPEELGDIVIEELDGIRKWAERPQKRIIDVLRSLSLAINNLLRMEFEEILLGMVAEEFEVIDHGYRVIIAVPKPIEEEIEERTPIDLFIILSIIIPNAYPLVPPDIEVDSEDEYIKTNAQVFLKDMLKSWAPNMFLADVINRLSLSLSNTSLFKCFICGQRECPICGLPLLTVPVEESEKICEMPCIHCKKPYHVHCLKSSLQEGSTRCSYCLSDLSGFFGRDIYSMTE